MAAYDKADQALPAMPSTRAKRSHRLGYDGEHAVEVYLQAHGFPCYRPRAGAARDRGDLGGLPLVVSVKNHASLALADWVNALPAMCRNAALPLGVVWHKRRNRGSPGDWYVTMTGDTFLVLMDAYQHDLEVNP